MKKIIIPIFISIFFVACKEETTTPDNPSTVNTTDPVNVLKDGSGFSHIYDDLMVLSSANSIPPSMGVLDFTLESNNNLNLAYYYSQPSQQDVLTNNKRITKNLTTNVMIPLPAGADDIQYSTVALGQQGKTVVLTQFRPYSNFFTYATYSKPGSGTNSAQFMGDIDCTVPSNANPIGTPDLGFRFPCMNIAVNANDNGFGSFAAGIPNPTYTLSGTSLKNFIFFNNFGSKIVTSFLESDVFTYGNYKAFFVRTDSLLAYTVSNDATSMSKITAVAVSGISNSGNYTTLRHYSTDGNILGMLIENTATKQIWTVSFNFTTGVMSKGLEGSTLDYSGAGTDYDLDEFGNVYYTGYASNGSNMNGVSIYKKNTAGTVSVVGQDNFLKFGQVLRVKTLMGKVYLAVTGKKTGTSAFQLSIIKED